MSLLPKERYATILYEAIRENGWTTGSKCGLYGSNLDEAKEEFKDHPWKYGNKALTCFDPWAGAYKFAVCQEEIEYDLRRMLTYISTRVTRGLKVGRTYKTEYGSTRELDRVIRDIEYSNDNTIYLLESGLYVARRRA